ncbi:MAG: lipocalin family protein, partial [Fibrobacterota bacterium]
SGKARLIDKERPGVFKVRFFGPFGGLYKIIALDSTDYQYAVITSGTRDYFWILSRTPKMDEPLYQSLLERARAWGFDVATLIRVPQD